MARGSSGCAKPLRHGRGWWPCSSGSTCREGSHPASCRVGTWRGRTSSMESSMSHQCCHRNRALSSSSGHEWSRLASRPLVTTPSSRCRRECVKSPAGGQRRGGRSEAGCDQCRSRHRGENRPNSGQRVVNQLGEGAEGKPTLMAAWRERAMSLSCSNLGLLPRISGSQNCPTAPFMCPILP